MVSRVEDVDLHAVREIPVHQNKGLNALLLFDARGESTRTLYSLVDLQRTLAETTGATLPDPLIKQLGMEGVDLVQIDHPLCSSLLWLGMPKGETARVAAENATITIEVELTTFGGGPDTNPFYPESLHIGGMDQVLLRPLGLEYMLRDPRNFYFNPNQPALYLNMVNIGVLGSEIPEIRPPFREGAITSIPTITDRYYRDLLTAALITETMIPHLLSGEPTYQLALKVPRVRYSMQDWHESSKSYPTTAGVFRFSGMAEGDQDQLAKVSFSPKIGSSWEITIPSRLDKA